MADLTGISNTLFQWILSPFIWIILIFVFLALTIGFLIIRKKRKLIYPCAEIVEFGEGKFGINTFKAGWYGKKTHLRGLWDTGDEVLKTSDGEQILDFSTEDFQEVNGKRAPVCYRDPTNQNNLVPISKARIKGKEFLLEIPPASFTDAAVDIVKDADKETADRMQKLVMWVVFGALIIFALVSIIVITQMVKSGQTEAADLILKAGEVCKVAVTSASGAP